MFVKISLSVITIPNICQMDPQRYGEVDCRLLTLLEALNDSMKIMEELDESKRESLYLRIADIMTSFRSLVQISHEVKGSVPLEVAELVDKGSDPTDFARKMVGLVDESGQRFQAKSRWMYHLKNSLDSLIAANFPGESLDDD